MRHQNLQDFPSFDYCQYQSLSKQPFLTKISPKKKKNQFDYGMKEPTLILLVT